MKIKSKDKQERKLQITPKQRLKALANWKISERAREKLNCSSPLHGILEKINLHKVIFFRFCGPISKEKKTEVFESGHWLKKS